jgi:hypothetical protein
MAAADWILPPRETMPTVARTVPEGERASLYEAKQVLVVHVQGEDGPDHMPLRASFGLTAALARELRGYVHDEATHRIDTAQAFAERLPKVPVGTPFFVPESLLVELHPLDEDDLAGPYRLLTLGMSRYGMPDLEMRGFHESDGGRLAAVVNAVASKLARGERGPEVTVSLADVAAVARKKPEELTRAPEKAKEAKVRLSLSERMAADPDNDVYRIEAPGEGDEDAHAALLATLYGEARVLGRGSSESGFARGRGARQEGRPRGRREVQKGGREALAPGPVRGPWREGEDRGHVDDRRLVRRAGRVQREAREPPPCSSARSAPGPRCRASSPRCRTTCSSSPTGTKRAARRSRSWSAAGAEGAPHAASASDLASAKSALADAQRVSSKDGRRSAK